MSIELSVDSTEPFRTLDAISVAHERRREVIDVVHDGELRDALGKDGEGRCAY